MQTDLSYWLYQAVAGKSLTVLNVFFTEVSLKHICNCMWTMKDQESSQLGCTLEKFILK